MWYLLSSVVLSQDIEEIVQFIVSNGGNQLVEVELRAVPQRVALHL